MIIKNKFNIGEQVKVNTNQIIRKSNFIIRSIYDRKHSLTYLCENIKTGCKEEIEEKYLRSD